MMAPSRGWFNCRASKSVVDCYVIICAIYLARLIEHLLQVRGRAAEENTPEKSIFSGLKARGPRTGMTLTRLFYRRAYIRCQKLYQYTIDTYYVVPIFGSTLLVGDPVFCDFYGFGYVQKTDPTKCSMKYRIRC
jgi:hypothetical protein